jgi:hypothetical protein
MIHTKNMFMRNRCNIQKICLCETGATYKKYVYAKTIQFKNIFNMQ